MKEKEMKEKKKFISYVNNNKIPIMKKIKYFRFNMGEKAVLNLILKQKTKKRRKF